MKGMKRWNLRQQNANSADNSLASAVLAARGIDIEDDRISDPLLIKDMDKAVEIIKSALCNGEKIVVFGDYDCDGITGTVILCQYLAAQGGEVDWYIPSRDEGYGLNFEAIDSIKEKGAKLIITVDNGISCAPEAAYIKEKGIKLIITDHHTAPSCGTMPEADAVVNPKRPDDTSPFKELAGCGVVLKLIMAIEDDIEGVLEQFADLAALGTIGDVVPMLGENRIIVKRGLEIMPYTENIGLYKLLKHSGFSLEEDDGKLTAGALSFTVCPRINVAGRFAHAKKAAELLLSETEELAEVRSAELTVLNNSRREAEGQILSQVDAIITGNPALLSERVLIINGENWHDGIIGIISSRLLTRWGKPNIVINNDGEFIRGSARSVDGFPLVPLLEHCSVHLEKFGGHVKAAGLTAKSENLSSVAAKIKAYSAEHFPEMPFDVLNIDKIIVPEDLSLENIESLKSLAPFGESNPMPLFLMQNCAILSKKPLKDGKFLSFNVKIGNIVQKILNFNCTYDDFNYENNQSVDILVTLDINEYNGTRSISAQLKDIRPSGFNQDRYFAALRTYERLVRGESIDVGLEARVIPEKEDVKIIYDILRLGITDAERIYTEAAAKGINYCKFRIIIDILKEFGLLEYNLISSKINLLTAPSAQKADLESSVMLAKVRSLTR
ncbi:MAG: single-stranded-DNA-specific exonuclease RecJ [Oscillospiraceae bacterium]|jgi:single-stranded-DNA-specific exonuclease|nr:single-stranded-DNA-specific exonuclease RecJ [Oscillospiraceae bacterium]